VLRRSAEPDCTPWQFAPIDDAEFAVVWPIDIGCELSVQSLFDTPDIVENASYLKLAEDAWGVNRVSHRRLTSR